MLMQERRAGGDHDPVEPMLANVLLNKLLPRLGAHVLVIAGNNDPGLAGNELRHRRTIHNATYIVTAMADVEADAEAV
jgi:hypothetical protein